MHEAAAQTPADRKLVPSTGCRRYDHRTMASMPGNTTTNVAARTRNGIASSSAEDGFFFTWRRDHRFGQRSGDRGIAGFGSCIHNQNGGHTPEDVARRRRAWPCTAGSASLGPARASLLWSPEPQPGPQTAAQRRRLPAGQK
ncbi:hypothetical protein HPB50_008175 [Hyalomma asiaticum]|uniref:Uncharacterized protein n=1 Tax=Hyalomma asiaticum TaxID=266040 RepID=A0ACB7TGY9_HYAAI|nr:hypothetical protein HPB50_008175 [Hyalomma asiaticum]